MTLRLLSALCTLLCASILGSTRDASALSLTVSGPTSGPLSSGIGSEASSAGAQLTFTIGLDAATAINGYDLTLAWDPAELSLAAAAPVAGLPFIVSPDAGASAGSRVASLTLTAALASLLFSVTFDVLGTSADGLADVRIFVDENLNGTGIAPGSLSLANPGGAGFDVIPEPASGALLALGLAGLSAARARARRSRS